MLHFSYQYKQSKRFSYYSFYTLAVLVDFDVAVVVAFDVMTPVLAFVEEVVVNFAVSEVLDADVVDLELVLTTEPVDAASVVDVTGLKPGILTQ